MSDETPRLKLAQLVSLQELNAVTWNEALAQLDTLVDLRLNDSAIDTPPATPAEGDAYLIGTAPTGAWSGYANQIAACLDGAWRFYAPYEGLRALVVPTATLIVYLGGAWQNLGSTDFATKSGSETLTNKALSGSANTFSAVPNAALVNAGVTLNGRALALGGSLALTASDVGGLAASGGALSGGLQVPNLGIATAPDATNKLAVSSAAVLFNHAGTDARLYLNKAASANTAATLYESNFSGRAEVGLCGDDNFHFKVSANATTWYDALTIAAASGRVTANYGLALSGSTSGATVLMPAATASGTLTLPSATDTLVGRTTTDTLGNKTFGSDTVFPGGKWASNGFVGIGIPSPSYPLTVVSNVTATAGTSIAAYAGISAAPPADTSGNYRAGLFQASTSNTNTCNFTGSLQGLNGQASFRSNGGTLANAYGLNFGVYLQPDAGNAATITNAYGVFSQVYNLGTVTGAVITNSYTLYAAGPLNSSGGTIAQQYGLYIANQTGGTQTNTAYGVYQAGSGDKNYFAGIVGVGTSSPIAGAQLDVAGHIFPHTDNSSNLGSASYRWGTVYAGSGTINTSGAAQKTAIRALSAAEIAVAKALADGVRMFRFIDAVTAKGDAARLHAGMIYEDVVAAFAAEGLDPLQYGIVCRDPATKTATRIRFVVDPDGNAVEELYEACEPDCDETGAPKYIVGLRYDELAQFVLAGLAARLAALEAS